MADLVGRGDIITWDTACLMIGRALAPTPMHSHYAIQIAFGKRPGIRFRADDRDPWTEYHAAMIASRQPHTMDASHVEYNAVLFIEPETREGRILSERYLDGGIVELSPQSLAETDAALFAEWHGSGDLLATKSAAERLIRQLTGGVGPAVVSDERILRAIAFIKSHLNGPLRLEQVAAEACLSPSRFRHLFVEETGTALRPYLLWRRFLRAWELVTRGESLSTAAHEAGFADAAHLTRTSRRMFGFAPSALQVNVNRTGASS
ncbi:MAG TPA: AraC family transcriptional regulator [Gemmatimonadaceae bacterium]|jgi:AraC-like DNA-binding protein